MLCVAVRPPTKQLSDRGLKKRKKKKVVLLSTMSDSSSSDEEESRFREVCDPTLWRTASQGVSNDEASRVEASDSPHHRHGQGDQRLSFMLLEKIRTSLANSHGKTACVWVRREACPTTQCRQAGRTEASTARQAASAPSTLTPFLAKQLSSTLDECVEYQHDQEHGSGGGGGDDGQYPQHLQQPLHLLNNLPLVPEASITPTYTPARKRRAAGVSRRLACFDGHNGVRLKEQCQSVAVSSEWILSGEAAYPRPHPKNVRYLQRYKLKERRADGSIIAIPFSPPDNAITATTTATTRIGKKKRRKGVVCVPHTGKGDSTVLQQGETLNGLQDGGVCEGVYTEDKKGVACASQTGKGGSAKIKHEETLNGLTNGSIGSDSNTRKGRKQTRKRGKKKVKGSGETAIS